VALNQIEVRLPLEPLPGGGVEKGHPKPLARSEKPTVRGKTFYVLCEAQGAYRMSGLTERPTSAADWDRPLRHVPFQQNRSPTGMVRHHEKKDAVASRCTLRKSSGAHLFLCWKMHSRVQYVRSLVRCNCAPSHGGASHWLNSGEVGKDRNVVVWPSLRKSGAFGERTHTPSASRLVQINFTVSSVHGFLVPTRGLGCLLLNSASW